MSQNNLPANGTADGSGSLAITFPPIANNTEFSGVLSIPTAPNTAQISVLVNGQQIATIGGSSQYGVIQINNNDVLQLTGTGFLPDTQYQAILSGFLAQGSVGQLIPTPTASQVEAALIGVIESSISAPTMVGTFSGTSGTFTVPESTRTIIVDASGFSDPGNVFELGGTTTGIVYYNQPFYLQDTTFNTGLAIIPVSGIADQTFEWHWTGGGTVTFTIYTDTQIYEESLYYNGPATAFTTTLALADTVGLGPAGAPSQGFRLASLTVSTTAVAYISLNGVQVLRALANTEAVMTFTPNLIVAAVGGSAQLTATQVGAGASAFSAVMSYP